jgi:hypothetical protein
MAKLGELKKGDVVVFSKRKDATRFLVDDVQGFALYIQEIDENDECYSVLQRSDISLATKEYKA